jgi:hypothetical protein
MSLSPPPPQPPPVVNHHHHQLINADEGDDDEILVDWTPYDGAADDDHQEQQQQQQQEALVASSSPTVPYTEDELFALVIGEEKNNHDDNNAIQHTATDPKKALVHRIFIPASTFHTPLFVYFRKVCRYLPILSSTVTRIMDTLYLSARAQIISILELIFSYPVDRMKNVKTRVPGPSHYLEFKWQSENHRAIRCCLTTIFCLLCGERSTNLLTIQHIAAKFDVFLCDPILPPSSSTNDKNDDNDEGSSSSISDSQYEDEDDNDSVQFICDSKESTLSVSFAKHVILMVDQCSRNMESGEEKGGIPTLYSMQRSLEHMQIPIHLLKPQQQSQNKKSSDTPPHHRVNMDQFIEYIQKIISISGLLSLTHQQQQQHGPPLPENTTTTTIQQRLPPPTEQQPSLFIYPNERRQQHHNHHHHHPLPKTTSDCDHPDIEWRKHSQQHAQQHIPLVYFEGDNGRRLGNNNNNNRQHTPPPSYNQLIRDRGGGGRGDTQPYSSSSSLFSNASDSFRGEQRLGDDKYVGMSSHPHPKENSNQKQHRFHHHQQQQQYDSSNTRKSTATNAIRLNKMKNMASVEHYRKWTVIQKRHNPY